MIAALKQAIKARWPHLRLRTILFASLFFVAALPGFGAIFLRVYENTLVRQTEAELVAQSAALAAAAQAVWPGAAPAAPDPGEVKPEPPRIDLNATPILPEREPPAPVARPPNAAALQAAEHLVPILATTRRTTLASILLLDDAGNILVGPGAGSYAALPEVRSALSGQPATVLRRNGAYRQVYRFEWLSRAAAIRVHHARPIVVNGRVVGVLLLSRSARALFKGLYEDRGKIALGILVILGILIVLSGVLSRGIARPIEALSVATRAVSAGGSGAMPAVPPTAAIEIQGLYVDFAAMAEAIDRRSRYLRDFAHAVSHEFKTPLAGIRGALELLRDHAGTMSDAERERFLANADADAERLTLLVSRLLELARADMTQAAPAETSLAPILARLADAERSPGFAILLRNEEAPPVAVPADTIEAILAALLDNSCQAGATELTIDLATLDDSVAITIADDGPGIAGPDRARIFEPFFTTRRARGGTGLGLPIVRSLLQAHGGTIELTESARTAFRITLPRAI